MKPWRKLSLVTVLLVGIHLLALLAGFVAPYNYATQDRDHPYARPSRIHFVDCAGKFHLRPFIYETSLREGTLNNYIEDCSQLQPIEFFLRGEKYALAGLVPADLHLFGVPSPARIYLLGADGFGRDEFSRVLYGAQISLFAGLLAAVLALSMGLLVGGVAGAFGGWVDEAVMRTAEIFIAVPWFYLLLGVRAVLPLEMSPLSAFVLVVAVIGLLNWGSPARLVRGVILSGRERNFVQAARGFGAGRGYLLRRHLLPMSFSVALTQMALLVPRFILAEVMLSFLGLGIGEPFPSWGNMLADAQQFHVLTAYWWMLLPALAPVPVFVAYHALADRLQERLQSAN
ncbi:MAG TPA: ABC transporter permease [Candidatus Angelobacter sp.]|nr:ABC transporter permease [Candidatus Angelobacter sp.]